MSDQKTPPVDAINDPSKATDSGRAQLDPRLVAVLVTAVVAVALFSVLHFVMSVANPRAQYRMTLVFLFFALSTASVLLFASQVKIKGVIGNLAVTMGGSATLWLVLLVIFNQTFKENDLFAPAEDDITLQKFASLVNASETSSGWQDYKRWSESLNYSSSVLLGEAEGLTRRNLVWYALYDENVPKLSSLHIDTLFFYFHKLKDRPAYALKLQRLVGQVIRSDNAPSGTTLAMSGDVGLPGAKSVTVLLARDRSEQSPVITAFVNNKSSQAQIPFSNIDSLMVSSYTDDTPDGGDYIVVDLKRYAADAQTMASLGVVNFDRKVTGTRMFAMRPRLVGLPGQIPVSFKEVHPTRDDSVKTITQRFDDWPDELDRVVTAKSSNLPPEVLDALKSILPEILQRFEDRGMVKRKGILTFHDLLTTYLSERVERAYQVSNNEVDFHQALTVLVSWSL